MPWVGRVRVGIGLRSIGLQLIGFWGQRGKGFGGLGGRGKILKYVKKFRSQETNTLTVRTKYVVISSLLKNPILQ